MAFDWSKYLELAEELSKRQDEACLRAAISRAYYSVYNIAKKRDAVSKYRFNNDGNSHDELWDLYDRNSTSGECRRLAFVGKRLKRRRVEADYISIFARLNEEVPAILEDAKECVGILTNLDKNLPQPIEKTWSY
jgi:uncharacterized protein (UPF0332 family)